MGRRKVRTDALRGELLSVATRRLSAGGSAALTTRAVAADAGASLATVDELFGGKAGLVRAIFAEGFARLADELRALETGDDPEADVIELVLAFRSFAHRHPHLYEVMFSRPFAEFRADDKDARAGQVIYGIVLGRVAALLGPARTPGSAKDAAIGLWALAHGLVSLESSGLLGGDHESIDHRFRRTVAAALCGFAAAATTR